MSFRDLFKSKERLAQEEADRIEQAITERKEFEERVRIETEKSILRAKMESATPWFEPVIGVATDAPLSERYLWNPAFIKDLTHRGYVGTNDVAIVQNYLDEQAVNETKKILEKERDEKRASKEPWVEVVGEKMDKEGMIELQLDWNTAFIHYLKQHGFRGQTDDIIVQQWLISLDKAMDGNQYQ